MMNAYTLRAVTIFLFTLTILTILLASAETAAAQSPCDPRISVCK
jgi:hypothetical protein